MAESEKGGGEKLLTAPFILLTVLSCMVTICLQMMVTAMPLLTVQWGYDPEISGISTTVCTLTALLLRPVSVRFSFKVGEKGCVLVGAALYAVVFFSCFFNTGLPGLLLLRSVQGFGMSLLTTALGAMATACLPKSRMAEGMAYFGLGNAVALSVGPSIGLLLSQRSGFFSLFLFGLILSLFIAFSLFFLRPPARQRPFPAPTTVEKKSFFRLAAESGSLFPSLASAILIFCQMSLSTYLAFWGKASGLEDVSIFFSVNLFGMIVSRLFMGWLRRFKEGKICAVSSALLAAAYFLVALFPCIPVLWVSGIFYGFGYGILYSLMNAAAVQHSNRETRGTANAVFFGAKDLGTALGAFLWGYFSGAFGYRFIFLLGGTFALAGSVGFTYWKINKQKKEVELYERA